MKYHVNVHFEGAVGYDVEAASEEEAEAMALECFAEEDNDVISANLADANADSVWPTEEEEQ